MSAFTERMIRAAKLDAALYEEVEADRDALPQAMGVVLLSSICAGIGNLSYGGIVGLVFGTIGALIGWYIWAVLTYLIGTKILPTPATNADVGQLLRTTGFSSTPGLIRVVGAVAVLRPIAFIVAGLWMLAAMIVAVRQALDYESTARAVFVCLIGFAVQVIVLALFFSLLGTPPR